MPDAKVIDIGPLCLKCAERSDCFVANGVRDVVTCGSFRHIESAPQTDIITELPESVLVETEYCPNCDTHTVEVHMDVDGVPVVYKSRECGCQRGRYMAISKEAHRE